MPFRYFWATLYIYPLACKCIDSAKDDQEDVKGDDRGLSNLGQPPNIEEINLAEVTPDKEAIIQSQPLKGMIMTIPGGPKNRNSRFLGLCSDQQLSSFTLLDRASFLHYNNTKIIKFG